MLRSAKQELLLQMSYASASKYVAVGLRMLRGLALAKILGPSGFGVWTSMRLVMLFGTYAHGGARPGMVQRATLAESAGDAAAAARYRSVAATVNLAGALAAGVVVAAAALLFLREEPSLAAWLALAAVLVLRGLWLFHQSLLASQRRYAWRTTLNLVLAAMTTGLGIWAALERGLLGFVMALAACYALALLLAPLWGGRSPRPAFEREVAGRLVSVGLPVMTSNLLKILLWNVDKLLLWLLVGNVALGVYALQSQITNTLMLLPAGVSEVFYPQLLSEIGRARSAAVARRYLERGTDLLVRSMLPLLAVFCLAIHLPIRWWMPEYTDAIAPGIVLVLATFFPVVGSLPGNVLVALGGQRALLAISVAALGVATLGVTAAIGFAAGYVGVAVGVALGLATRAGLVLRAALERSGMQGAAAARFVCRLVASFGLLLVSVAAARWALPDEAGALWMDTLHTLGRCGIALALLAPWTLSAWWPRPRLAASSGPDREEKLP